MNPEREDKRVSNTSGGVVPQVEAGSKRQSLEREHVATGGADIVEGQVGKLRTLFPEVFVEGKIDEKSCGRLLVRLRNLGQGGLISVGPARMMQFVCCKRPAAGLSFHMKKSQSSLIPHAMHLSRAIEEATWRGRGHN